MHSCNRLIGLPQSTTFEDLLGQKGTAATKGAMKGTAAGAGASRMGVARRVTTKHPVDGKSLVLEMQVCPVSLHFAVLTSFYCKFTCPGWQK